ncbi:MAG TPA: response regulator [Aggregatilineales bacterium]|nr:response regulator [Anaerolineales bacterium]HRE46111.1 response regulator [Aggregatilineales bacterium]
MSNLLRRVLVVEDDPDSQAVLAHILAHWNIIIDTVSDAANAQAMLAANSYQAVVIDLKLPDKDGWTLLRVIRESPFTADLFCVAITAYDRSYLDEDALNAGFDAYFAKPVDLAGLGRVLEARLAPQGD